MSCVFNDITVVEKVTELVSAIGQLGDILSPAQITELAAIGEILDSVTPLSIDDQLNAIREALEEIRDR